MLSSWSALSSFRASLTPWTPLLSSSSPLHTSVAVLDRRHRRVKSLSPLRQAQMAYGRRNQPTVPLPKAPLASTFHPKSKFEQEENQLMEAVKGT